MTARILFAAAGLLVSTSAWAQTAPAAEQTSEDLICQLSEKCDEAAASPAEAAVADKPTSRVSATRGFKISRKTEAPVTERQGAFAIKKTPGTTQPRAAYQAGKNKAASASAGKAKFVAANAKAMPLGRADLRVSFVTGSAELTEAGQREAQKFAAALGSPLLAGMRFTIEGHTDAVGDRSYNLDLSRRRAQAVVDYLVGKGVDRARFDVVGYGFDRPLGGVAATAGVNRRVEVVRNK